MASAETLMGLVYLTGTSGVGKTTVGEELNRRGYKVYDVDADRLARWYENASDAEVAMPAYRDDRWYAESWRSARDPSADS